MFRQNHGDRYIRFSIFPPASSVFFTVLTTKEISILSYNTNSNLPFILTSFAISLYICFIDNIC